MSDAILQLKDIRQSFAQGDQSIDVLRGLDLDIQAGELVAIVGPSGVGKSTLLHLCGLLEAPSGGALTITGQDCSMLDDNARTRMRRESIGFVYQFHNLLPEFTALENVRMPMIVAGSRSEMATQRATELLNAVGLEERLQHLPGKLSGGEQQRVAIARAFANKPRLVLADEPTGNLDETTAEKVMQLFVELIRKEGAAALIATHSRRLADSLDRTIVLHDGLLETN